MKKWLRYSLLCRRWYCKLVRRSNPLSSAQPDITSNTSTKWQEQPNLRLHIFLVWWIRKREKAGWWCSDKRKSTFSSSQTWLPEVSIFHCFKTSSILIFPLVWSCLFIDQVEQQEQAKKGTSYTFVTTNELAYLHDTATYVGKKFADCPELIDASEDYTNEKFIEDPSVICYGRLP